MIKNNTVYTGKPKLKFKRHTDYSHPSVTLNKIHLNLGFTKLISVVPTAQFDRNKLRLIAEHTGAIPKGIKITNTGINGIRPGIYTRPTYSKDTETLYTTGIFNGAGKYLGTPEDGWFMYQQGWTVDPFHKGICYSEKEKGYVAVNHRGYAIFKMYDMLYDPKWRPQNPVDFIEYWQGKIPNASNSTPVLREQCLEHIPFTKRGFMLITKPSMARQAAINLYETMN